MYCSDNLDTDIYGANLYNRYLSRLIRKREMSRVRQRTSRNVPEVESEKLPSVGAATAASLGSKARAAATTASARLGAAVTGKFRAQAAFSSSYAHAHASKSSATELLSSMHDWVDEPDLSAHLYGIDSSLAAYETRVDHVLAEIEMSQAIETGEAPALASRCTSILVRTGVHSDSNGDLDDQQGAHTCYENGLSFSSHSQREQRGWKDQWAVARATGADLSCIPQPRAALRHIHREFPDVPALRQPNLVVDHVADAVRRVFGEERFKPR